MTKNEADKIFDDKGDEVLDKLLDYILIEEDYDKATKFIMDVTGCDEKIASEIAFETFPPRPKAANKCIPKCPTCGSTNLKPAGILDYIFTTSHGTNTHSFVCKNCGYEW